MLLSSEWFTPSELAGLPGMPSTDRRVRTFAERNEFQSRKRSFGKGFEYHYSSLPLETRAALLAKYRPQLPGAASRPKVDRDALWAKYGQALNTMKAEAQKRFAILREIESLVHSGTPGRKAVETVAAQNEVAPASVYRWKKRVRGLARELWVPALLPSYSRLARHKKECPPEAWDVFYKDYMSNEAPTLASSYRRLQRIAGANGWVLPSKKWFDRAVAKLDPATVAFARGGLEALQRMYPAQERFVNHAMEAINADGHVFDVFVKWEDGSVSRPVLVAWQDFYSGKLLAWRVGKSESSLLVRLSFGELVEKFGIPEHVVLDNGRSFVAKCLTAGVEHRYRFKIKEDDPIGIFPQLEIDVHFTQVYHGQSKPIERYFRDLCDWIARHPACKGAYTGNNPVNKPANYGEAAVPWDKFIQLVEQEILAANALAGRRSKECDGRSFDETFAQSYAGTVIRRASLEQRNLWLLESEAITVRQDSTVHALGQRYFSEAVAAYAGQKIVARFDPSRAELPLQCYATDGTYIGEAEMLSPAYAFDTEAADVHASKRGEFVKKRREAVEEARSRTPEQIAAMLPTLAEPQTPTTKVVKGVFKKPAPVALEPLDDEDSLWTDALRALRSAAC